MRSRVLLLAVGALLCTTAHAKRKPQDAVEPSAPSLDEDPCPTTPPYGFVLEVGHATGTRAEALQAARDQARTTLIENATAGYDPLQRAAVIRHIRHWRDGRYTEPERKGEPGSACAAVAVKLEYLDLIERQYAEFSAGLDALAESIRAGVGAQPFVLQPPRWASGCPSSDLGQALAAQLKLRLAGMAVRKTQDFQQIEGEDVPTYPELWVELAPGHNSVTLSAQLREPRAEGDRLLGGFDFPLSLFNIEPDERGVCHDEAVLGLERGRLVGADGLVVQVDFPTDDGVICEGQKSPLGLHTNMPAQVWLFSVAADGQAWLIWPGADGTGLVNGPASVGDMDVARMPTGGDERFLAVALPRGSTWGAAQGWKAQCRVPVKLEELTWPAGAAIGSEVFSIAPAGVGACPEAQVYDPQELMAYLDGLPECGS